MQQRHIKLIDFLDMLTHPLPGLIKPLGIVNDRSLKIGAIVVVAIQLMHVLIGEYLVVEGDWILVGLEPADDFIEG